MVEGNTLTTVYVALEDIARFARQRELSLLTACSVLVDEKAHMLVSLNQLPEAIDRHMAFAGN